MRTMTKTEDGNLVIDLGWMLSYADDDTLIDIYDGLSCTDAVIKNVADQIADGWTDLCSHGATSIDAEAHPTSGLDYAVRKMCKLSGERAEKEIDSLEKCIDKLKKKISDHNSAMQEKFGYENCHNYTI